MFQSFFSYFLLSHVVVFRMNDLMLNTVRHCTTFRRPIIMVLTILF